MKLRWDPKLNIKKNDQNRTLNGGDIGENTYKRIEKLLLFTKSVKNYRECLTVSLQYLLFSWSFVSTFSGKIKRSKAHNAIKAY